MKVEELIEEAMVDIMQARTYVTTNSIPVVRYRDANTGKGDAWIACHALPNGRLSPTHNFWRVPLELMAATKSAEDLKAVVLDDLIEQCNDEIQETLTVSTLQAAINTIEASSGVTINGIVPTEGDDTDGDYQGITANADISLTYIKP